MTSGLRIPPHSRHDGTYRMQLTITDSTHYSIIALQTVTDFSYLLISVLKDSLFSSTFQTANTYNNEDVLRMKH